MAKEETKNEKPKLKTLAQHNAEMNARNTEETKARKDGKPNGIACPLCKEELRDTFPGLILASIPPQMDVHCPACGWTGHRIC